MRVSGFVASFVVTGAWVAVAACGGSSSSATSLDGANDGGVGGGADGGSGHGGSADGGGGADGAGGGADAGGGGGADGGDAGAAMACTSAGTGLPVGAVTGFPFPTVTPYGGAVVTAPDIVTVTFSGDTSPPSQLASFGSSLASSCYWDTIRAGYCIGSSCVGDGPAGTAVALTTPAAGSYTDSAYGGASSLQTALAALTKAGSIPAPTASTIYELYFTASTRITLDGAPSCESGGFDGYHNQMTIASQAQPVVYSVIPECPPVAGELPATTLENTTITASHEAIESATDGITASSGASGFYLDFDTQATYDSSEPWNDIFGGEVADLCVDPFGLGQDETLENGFTVQRIWSLANAAAGSNPCVPIPAGERYFNTYPQYPVVEMAVGASATIDVTALADPGMGSWTLVPEDWTDPSGAQTFFTFSIATDAGTTDADAGAQTTVTSGETVQLTITMTSDPATLSGGNGWGDIALVSANSAKTAAHVWPFIALTPADAADAGLTMMRHAAPVRRPSREKGWARHFLDGIH
jgi:hypothetical protein